MKGDDMELLKRIEELVGRDPSASADVLDAVRAGLAGYAEAQRRIRDSRSDTAIKHLMILRHPTGKKHIKTVAAPVVSFHFPSGFDGAHSRVEKQFLEEFCEAYFPPYNRDAASRAWEDACAGGSAYFDMLASQWEKSWRRGTREHRHAEDPGEQGEV
jgi:hypothetical protein